MSESVFVVTDAVLLEIGNALSRMDRNAAVQIKV
jgi:hypothetical protein